MSFSQFKISSTPLKFQPDTSNVVPPPPLIDQAPTFSVLDYYIPEKVPETRFGIPDDPRGSFEYDQKHDYHLQWASLAEFKIWQKKEEISKGMSFTRSQKDPNHDPGQHWTSRWVYLCSRGKTGGNTKYKKKHDRDRKIGSRRCGCKCRLTIKMYPNTSTVLGMYNSEHNHDLGSANAKFTRLSKDTRRKIENLLRLGVQPKHVVRSPHIYVPFTQILTIPIICISSIRFKAASIPRQILRISNRNQLPGINSQQQLISDASKRR